MLFTENHRLIFRYDAEETWIEPWGLHALRVRSTKERQMPLNDWALQEPSFVKPEIIVDEHGGSICNGKIKAVISKAGKITISNFKDETLLEEYDRAGGDILNPKSSAINVKAREFKPLLGGDYYHLTMRFESLDKKEKIYGMGQYQHAQFDLKGADLELAQRNSQASVPFAMSSLGYGLLWNNPGIGRAVLGTNIMSFECYSTKVLDYWITAGETPAEIEENYALATGTVPIMPEFGLGFWQCKLRYQTQEELLTVAREHRRRGLPLDVMVIDFFHWPRQGEWKFDPTYWPNPGAMMDELKSLGIELMVSVWPTVEKASENYGEMLEKGYLIHVNSGVRAGLEFEGLTIHYDATNPAARNFLWKKAEENYYSHGIKTFWLDVAEPEYTVYDFDNYRYWLGNNATVGNWYPVDYARTFYDGLKATGEQNVVNLIRCAWAGSQKYGALVWSGDVASSWVSMRTQLAAGLNMGIAGIPWWTTDIGGFHGGNPDDEAFRELFVRWFQWGTFCPVMRMHGNRVPVQPQHGTTGGATCLSGAPNEVWSYGDDVYKICQKYMNLREQLRPYIRGLMKAAHEKGTPLMRPCFYEFPEDSRCWETEDQFMFGEKYLCCPILNPGQRKRTVYLPRECNWKTFPEQKRYEGGQTIEIPCPIDWMPVFEKQ